jgi:diketogulonate reductase-like aldo/keto reductase
MVPNKIITKTVTVPSVGFGTYKLTGNACLKAVDEALQIGYRHIDTAQFYNNEDEVGLAIKNSGISRGNIFITIKVFPTDFNRIIKATEESLRKLKMDYVDLLLLHWPSDDETNKIAIDGLNDALNKGYAKNIGVSNFNIEKLSMALEHAPVVCNQVEYHPYISQEKLLAYMKAHGLFLTAYSPLAKGRVIHEGILLEMAAKHNKTVSQVVLRWLLQQGDISVIPKASSVERIKENLNVFDFSLPDKDMEMISGLRDGHRITNSVWSPNWD